MVGVGGAGTNAINRMIEAGVQGVEFIAINTDAQALAMCEADHKLRIGGELTKGLGGGSDPKVGRDAAMAAYEEIKTMLKGSDMVFITAGEGGGTGTGAAPVVAEIARSLGALTIGVVTFPFAFEGKRRGMQALEGVRALKQRADTVIVVPNHKLLEVSDRGTTMVDALRLADDVLRQGVQGVCDLVTVPGLINLDLADVRTVMMGAGTAHMGIGQVAGRAAGAAGRPRWPSSPRCWTPPSRERGASCSTSAVARTCRCTRSPRWPRPWPPRRSPTPPSSSARWWTSR